MSDTEQEVPVVAIDGPGGAGKGTIARAVADRLGWHLLDSGALYRLVALDALERNIAAEDEEALARLARNLEVEFNPRSGGVRLAGRDVTEAIRSEECGRTASRVAALVKVRAALADRQRAFRKLPGLVADGRDMGSVIFADAKLKIFLTASVEERARRRYKQLKDKGIDVSLSALSRDMADRDERDSDRSVAPLKASPDAKILDTTSMSIEAVIATVLGWVDEVWHQGMAPEFF